MKHFISSAYRIYRKVDLLAAVCLAVLVGGVILAVLANQPLSN